MEQEEINEDPLRLALTRPAMAWGIPNEAFVSSIAIGGIAMIIADSLFYLVLTIPLLAISRLIVANDHNAFRVWARYLDTSAAEKNRAVWGGSSVTPLRLTRKYKISEID